MATSRSSSSLLAGTNTREERDTRSSFFHPIVMPWPDAAPTLAPLGPWFEGARRRLPWRAADLGALHPDPYAVLVSEVMLQQTQVATVVPYFEAWMDRFPDLRTLATAPEEAVLQAWQGLGYYRRARNLHAAAQKLAVAGWPQDLESLRALPGLGPYTAAAVAALAFQLPEPALDGNLFRVLARLLALDGDPRLQARDLTAWLRPALAVHGPSRTLQGLMELGATHCAPGTPRCEACPLAAACEGFRQGRAGELPPPRPRIAVREEALWLLAFSCQGRWLLRTPQSKGLLSGLWRWPTLPGTLPEGGAAPPSLAGTTHEPWTQVYTHRRERITPVLLATEGPSFPLAEGWRWVDTPRLATLPMGRRDQRLRALLLEPWLPCNRALPLAGLWQGLRTEAMRSDR